MRAVILAGGKGTRLASRLNGLPKPLVDVGGKPLLQIQLELLERHGIKRVCILVNHLAEKVEAFCAANGNFGMELDFVDDGEPRGTAGAFLAALPGLGVDEDILILYGDTLLNVDLDRFQEFHEKHGGAATIFTHPNAHPHDSDLVETGADNRVSAFHPYPHAAGSEHANLVNAALYILRPVELIKWRAWAENRGGILDFAKDLFPLMLDQGIYSYKSHEYIRDIGSPERLDQGLADMASGVYAQGSLASPRMAVFLDRDGVINKENGFISRKEDFELLPGAAEGIRRLNAAGILCVVATNQPVIARGECDEAELDKIHARMDFLLGRAGAYVDRLYYCPHHPDRGFAGERPELKIACQCRKPATGLIERAVAEMNIDKNRSWLIGDSTADILAANSAGLRSILVKTGRGGRDGKYRCAPDMTAENLREAAEIILQSR